MTHPVPSPDASPASAKPPRRGWRPLRWLGVSVLALLLTLAALAGWATSSEQGFAWAWRSAAALSHGRLGVGTVRGTLWQGFELQRLRWQDPARVLEVERLRLDWLPAALWRGTLHLTRLELGHVRFTSKAAAPAAPPRLPESLALPLTVALDRFALASLTLLPGDVRLYDVAGAYRYEGGQHRVRLARLNSPWGGGTAALTLADARPFALSGSLAARGVLEEVAIKADLGLAGSLAELQARGTVAGRGLLAEVSGRFDPFAKSALNRFRRLDLRVGGINPQALQPSWPKARLNFAVYAEPAAGATVVGGLSLVNSEAGALSAGRLPLAFLAGEFRVRDERLTLSGLEAQLAGGGRVALAGTLDARTLALSARLQDVALRALHSAAPDETVAGTLTLTGTPTQPRLGAALKSRQLALDARVALEQGGAQALRLEQVQLSAAGGRLALAGRVELQQARRFELSGALERADPARFIKGWPAGDLNARLTARGQLASPLAATVRLQFSPSRLSGAPLTGRAELDLQPGRLKRLDADLRLADNRLQAGGSYGAAGDRLKLLIDAPNLRLLGPGFAGRVGGQLDLAGTPKLPLLSANLKAERLALPGGGVGVEALTLVGDLQADAASPFRLQLDAQRLRLADVGASTLRLNAAGQRNRHRIELDGRLSVKQQPYTLALRASGGLAAGSTQWQGTLEQLQLAGKPGLTLLAPASLSVGPQWLELGATRLAALGGTLELQQLRRDGSGRLDTRGRAAGIHLAELAPFVALPVRQTLVVSGDWALSGSRTLQGQINLQRAGGDVWLPGSNGRQLALELGTSRAGLRLDGSRALFDLQLQSRYLNASGSGSMPLNGGIDGRTPLAATLQLEVPTLKALAGLAGPGLELGGQLAANVALSGPLAAPLAQGRLDGKGLLFADRKTGLRLADGVLEARLDGRRLLLDRLRFASGEGEALASGTLDLRDSGPDATVRVSFKRFSVFDRPTRRLVISGDGDVAFAERKLTLTGRVRADQGRVELPKLGTPQLSDDVHVAGRESAPPSALATLPVTVRLDLDLGERFRFTGQGLDVELSGVVRVSAAPGEAPAARGQVRVVKGRYKAYGQDLDIEYGTITFTGALDNPALNVRAKRRLSPVGAGVEVGGSVAAPSIRLIADEALSERDKLSWLVLGRASAGGTRDDAALAAAAGALLAGTINDRLGLFDDLGLVSQQQKTRPDGTVSPAEQVVTVGRQLTRELYLGYEYGIASANQAVKLAYQLSKGWSLVLRAGSTASLETRYTLRFD
ncbi:MAG: translocation/assembly module TamB domain-containing protein [Pseudogulbenkiania sp.]|nr:translocation/assembly module TamB domain-containing protein [Pseudogulbenkiania sp.]